MVKSDLQLNLKIILRK